MGPKNKRTQQPRRMIPPEVVRMVQRLLKAGWKTDAIAERTGVGHESIRRVRLGQLKPNEAAYRQMMKARRAAGEPEEGPLHRCEGCGGWTPFDPCILCRVREVALVRVLTLPDDEPEDDVGIVYLPDAAELAARCAEVRQGWSPQELVQRGRVDDRVQRARVPSIEMGLVTEAAFDALHYAEAGA